MAKTIVERIRWGRILLAGIVVVSLIGGISLITKQGAVQKDQSGQAQGSGNNQAGAQSPYRGGMDDNGVFIQPTVLEDETGILWINPEKPMIALTFDDGPGGDSSDRIYETLKENNAYATFFMLGKQAEQYPEKVKRLEEIGCQIASHTYDHTNLTALSSGEILKQEQKAAKAFQDAGSEEETFLLRPPYGDFNDAVKETVAEPLILWSVDTRDWDTRDVDSICNKFDEVQDGDIVLMHEIYDASAEALEKVIPKLREKGFQFVTVDQLFAVKEIELKKGMVYRSANIEAY